MTEIQPYQQPQTQVADYQTAAVQRLGEWAQSAQAAYKVAEQLVTTSFVPQAFRGKPIEATAAILAGTEVGLSPMSALRAFDVIQGQAAPRAITLRAIVQSYGHEMVLVESTATRCRMQGRRRGTSEWQSVTWTIDRARDLQLTGKDNWKKQPAAMLMARATSELARLIAADAILGIGYSVEEIADGGTVEQQVAEQTLDATPTTTRRMSRKKAEPAPTPEQPSDPEPEEDAGNVESITDAQSRKLHASFNDLGITDRDMRLAYCVNLIGREIGSSSELTKAEASQVIEALAADLSAQPDADSGADAEWLGEQA